MIDIEQRREYRGRISDLERQKNRFKLVSLGGTLITTAALALELFGGGLVKPKDVGYVFTSDSVSISQENPDDFTSKEYTVYHGNGASVFTFEDLEEIEHDVHGGYTSVPEDRLPEGVHLGIRRVEDNPGKAVYNGIMFAGAIAGLGTLAASQSKIGNINEEIDDYKGRMRR